MYLAVSHSNVNRRFTLRVEHINARLKIQQLLKKMEKKKKKINKARKEAIDNAL
jgi:hemerythrin-like domain-containing protein